MLGPPSILPVVGPGTTFAPVSWFDYLRGAVPFYGFHSAIYKEARSSSSETMAVRSRDTLVSLRPRASLERPLRMQQRKTRKAFMAEPPPQRVTRGKVLPPLIAPDLLPGQA